MFSYSQSIGRPGTSLPTLYYLSNVYVLKLLVPTSTNTKKLIISHWCYFQFELILPHGTMVLKCTPNRRNADVSALWASLGVDLENNKHSTPNVHCWPQSTQGVGWLSVCTVLLITRCSHCHRVVSSHTLIPHLFSCSNTRLTAACRLLFPSVDSKYPHCIQTCGIIQVFL